jgi:O-antigen/teichoic acid export membrane protein
MDSVARGTLINLCTRVLGIALGLSIVLVTARLGPSAQGGFALFTAVESALLMLGSGFGVALARRVSHHGERPTALVGAVVVFCAGVGLACSVAMFAVAAGGDSGLDFLRVLAWSVPIMFITPSLSGLWLGSARMAALARISLAPPLLTIAGMGLALFLHGSIELRAVLWSWVAARVLVALATLAAAWRQGWIARPRPGVLGGELRFVIVIGMTNLIGLLNYKADLFLVEHFLGRSSTGVYSVAVMIAELLWLVSSSVTQAAYARIGTPDAADASRLTLRVVHASLLALALLAPALWLVAAGVLPRLLGADYAAALPVLAWLLPGVLAYGAASALSAYFTNHAGRPLIPAALASFSLLVNVLLSILLIPRLGMLGGALATTVSYLASIGVAAVVFRQVSGTPLRLLLQPDWPALVADLRRLAARPLRV